MPAPLKVDWSLAQSLYQEGLTLSSVARRTGIPYDAICQKKHREHWKRLVMEADKISPSSQLTPVSASNSSFRVSRWTDKVLQAADAHLSAVLDKSHPKVSIQNLEKLARILDITDRTGRRVLGMDGDTVKHTHVLVDGSPSARADVSTGEIVDVETVPEVDSPSVSEVNPS